jgi:hypothetical protein
MFVQWFWPLIRGGFDLRLDEHHAAEVAQYVSHRLNT